MRSVVRQRRRRLLAASTALCASVALQACEFPRCARRATHTHHITWRSRGGPTTIDNLISLCTRCHKRVHEGGWTLTGTPETLTTTPPGAHPPQPIAPTIRQRIAGLLPRHPQPTPTPALNAG